MNDDWCLESRPEEALDTRRNFLGDVEVLIKWKELPEFENSWESMDTLRKEFTGFLLEVRRGELIVLLKHIVENVGVGTTGSGASNKPQSITCTHSKS